MSTIDVYTGTVNTGLYESLVSGNSVFDLLYSQFNTTGFLLVGAALLAASGLLAIKTAPTPYEIKEIVRDKFRKKKKKPFFHQDSGYHFVDDGYHINRLDNFGTIPSTIKPKPKRKKKTLFESLFGGGGGNKKDPKYADPNELNFVPYRPTVRPPIRFNYDVHGFEEDGLLGEPYYVRRREDAGLLKGANSNLAVVRRVYEKEGGRGGGENPYWRSRVERPLVFAPPPAVPTWRGPTTTAPRPKHIQVFTRPKNQLTNDIKNNNMNTIMDRLRDSAYGNNNNNNNHYDYDNEYYYDDYSYEDNDIKPQTLIAATTAKPLAAAQYLPYFNRPYNRDNKDGNLKNSFVSPSYKQKPLVLSHYYKKRKKK